MCIGVICDNNYYKRHFSASSIMMALFAVYMIIVGGDITINIAFFDTIDNGSW